MDGISIIHDLEEVDDKQPGSSVTTPTPHSEEGDEHMLLLPTLDPSPTILLRDSVS